METEAEAEAEAEVEAEAEAEAEVAADAQAQSEPTIEVLTLPPRSSRASPSLSTARSAQALRVALSCGPSHS